MAKAISTKTGSMITTILNLKEMGFRGVDTISTNNNHCVTFGDLKQLNNNTTLKTQTVNKIGATNYNSGYYNKVSVTKYSYSAGTLSGKIGVAKTSNITCNPCVSSITVGDFLFSNNPSTLQRTINLYVDDSFYSTYSFPSNQIRMNKTFSLPKDCKNVRFEAVTGSGGSYYNSSDIDGSLFYSFNYYDEACVPLSRINAYDGQTIRNYPKPTDEYNLFSVYYWRDGGNSVQELYATSFTTSVCYTVGSTKYNRIISTKGRTDTNYTSWSFDVPLMLNLKHLSNQTTKDDDTTYLMFYIETEKFNKNYHMKTFWKGGTTATAEVSQGGQKNTARFIINKPYTYCCSYLTKVEIRVTHS